MSNICEQQDHASVEDFGSSVYRDDPRVHPPSASPSNSSKPTNYTKVPPWKKWMYFSCSWGEWNRKASQISGKLPRLGGGFKIFSIFTPTWGRCPFQRLKPPTRTCLLFIVSQGKLPKYGKHQANWVRWILMFVVCQDSKSEFSHWVKVACFFFCGVFAQKMIHKNYLKTAWMLNMVKPYIDLGVFLCIWRSNFRGAKSVHGWQQGWCKTMNITFTHFHPYSSRFKTFWPTTLQR